MIYVQIPELIATSMFAVPFLIGSGIGFLVGCKFSRRKAL